MYSKIEGKQDKQRDYMFQRDKEQQGLPTIINWRKQKERKKMKLVGVNNRKTK